MKKVLVLFIILCTSISYGTGINLRWAADTESGAPNVFYDDDHDLCGFEKEIIEEISKQLGWSTTFCQNDWDWLVPGLVRGLYDVVIDGLSSDEAPAGTILFSIPYYACQLSLVVRDDEKEISSLGDCRNRRVGTLKSSKASNILKTLSGTAVADYSTEYAAFSDLKNNRVDAVLIDYPPALYCGLSLGGLKIVDSVDEIQYSIAINPHVSELVAPINDALLSIIKNGRLQAIIDHWNLDNKAFQRYISTIGHEAYNDFVSKQQSRDLASYFKLLPIFGRAALMTLFISIFGMAVAVLLGLVLVLLRMYAPRWIGMIVIMIVEVIRGTPLLIQLFFIFYGLPFIGITLKPIIAGIAALGINYASYEAENFRAGLMAVPTGQTESARALGMTQWQSLRYVIFPQAFSFVLPPLTNDFIAIIKDSSLVSLVTIVELTKAYTTAANLYFDFFGTGILVAIFYFLLGLPFVQLARLAENHLALEKRAYRSKRAAKK